MKRIVFITGHYGSGKTEVALNLAEQLHIDYLFDLDIINPYFRSRTFKDKLTKTEVIASDLENDRYSDLPYISKKILLPFMQHDKSAIYDLGGSDLGIKMIKQFSKENMDDCDMYMVVNVFRPETQSVDNIIALIQTLEMQSGMKITGLINNSNLLTETTNEDIAYGLHVIKQVEERLHIPLIYTCVEQSMDLNTKDLDAKVIMLKRYFHQHWNN